MREGDDIRNGESHGSSEAGKLRSLPFVFIAFGGLLLTKFSHVRRSRLAHGHLEPWQVGSSEFC